MKRKTPDLMIVLIYILFISECMKPEVHRWEYKDINCSLHLVSLFEQSELDIRVLSRVVVLSNYIWNELSA